MRDLLQSILAAGNSGADLAVTTVIAVSGSMTVQPGARLLIRGDGEVEGRIQDTRLASAMRQDGLECLRTGQGRTQRYEWPGEGTVEVFYDVYPAPPQLVICGAGHIALPLCRLAVAVGFQVTVIDDRPEYADPARFPDARQVLARPFAEALGGLIVGPSTYLAIITRGHSYDAACLRRVIGSTAAYIGMIGSRKRVWAVLSTMRAEGYPVAQLERVHAPIGLPIRAETPAEIALSIVAEVVSVRRQGPAWSLAFKQGKHLERLREDERHERV